MKLFTMFVLIFLYISAFADNKIKYVKVKNIEAEVVGTFDKSLNSLIKEAINAAKIEALKQGGLSESISAFNDLFQGENSNLESCFTSGVLTNINGNIKDVIVKDTVTSTKGQLQTVKVIIDATVIKYNTKNDLSFGVKVEGVKNFYNNNEELEFKVKSSKNCYLSIFLVAGAEESYVLFPNDYENSFMLKAGKQTDFPTPSMEYVLDTKKDLENHRMIIVATKVSIPYNSSVSYQNILQWIFNIPPDQRTMSTLNFKVINNK